MFAVGGVVDDETRERSVGIEGPSSNEVMFNPSHRGHLLNEIATVGRCPAETLASPCCVKSVEGRVEGPDQSRGTDPSIEIRMGPSTVEKARLRLRPRT